MTIEGYFDGTAVRTLEPVDLKPNQKVFTSVLDNDLFDSKKQSIQEKQGSINSVYGMLFSEESKAVEDSIHTGIKNLKYEATVGEAEDAGEREVPSLIFLHLNLPRFAGNCNQRDSGICLQRSIICDVATYRKS